MRTIRWIAVVLVAIAPIAALALWMTFQHVPAWYRPLRLSPEQIDDARATITLFADSVSDQMVETEPFEIVLTESQVNAWLAAMPHMLSEAEQWLPTQWSGLVVRFDVSAVRLGAHYSHRGWRAILSVGISARLAEDAQTVHLQLTDVHGGSLALPRWLVADLLDEKLHEAFPSELLEESDDLARIILSSTEPAHRLFEGIELPNRFIWPNGQRRYRLESLELAHQEVRLKIKPL